MVEEKKTILIIRGNIQNAKSYPFWEELIHLLSDDFKIKEIKGILPENEIIDLINECFTYITVDSFVPHLCKYYNLKPGIVLWNKSDPLIFGYKTNMNLLKDRKYLRPDQFGEWRGSQMQTDGWLSAEEVFKKINEYLKVKSL